METVKAEILWTRNCHLDCQYCGMVTGRPASYGVERWKETVDNLKKLGCGFMAFYGAEPLYDPDFEELPEVVGYAESQGIHTTVITSGVASNVKQKIDRLIEAGARSLSMSYDMVPLDKHSKAKTGKALQWLTYFRDNCKDLRDVAAIATLTSTNFHLLPETIETMSSEGIWMFFDMIHPDRGQHGSKTRNLPGTEELLFKPEHHKNLKHILDLTMEMSDDGYLVHTSREFVDLISANDFAHLQNYSWHCTKEKMFPSWVTIDCDGRVLTCDDYTIETPIVFGHELVENWDRFCEEARKDTLKCPGCIWNTHIDAMYIKEGSIPFSNYVHTL